MASIKTALPFVRGFVGDVPVKVNQTPLRPQNSSQSIGKDLPKLHFTAARLISGFVILPDIP